MRNFICVVVSGRLKTRDLKQIKTHVQQELSLLKSDDVSRMTREKEAEETVLGSNIVPC